MQKELRIKSVSVEDFVKAGFYFGIILGVIGDIIVIISPSSRVTAGIPFFTYNATRTIGGLILFPIVAIVGVVFDFFLIALFINLVLYLSKGIRIYLHTEE
jgi:hypothetical protein